MGRQQQIVDHLAQRELIDATTADDLYSSHGEQAPTRLPAVGLVDEETLLEQLALCYDRPPAGYLDGLYVQRRVFESVDAEAVREYEIVPVRRRRDGRVDIIAVEPLNDMARQIVEERLGGAVREYIWPRVRFLQARHFFLGDELPGWVRSYLREHPVRFGYATPEGELDVQRALQDSTSLHVYQWDRQDVREFIDQCYDRDTLLKILLGFAGGWLTNRMIAVVTSEGIQPYFAEDWPELTERFDSADDLRQIRVDSRQVSALRSADSWTSGDPEQLELPPLFEALQVDPPELVAVFPVCIGGRNAMGLVGVPTDRDSAVRLDEVAGDFEPKMLREATGWVGAQLEEMIQRAKQDSLPPPAERIPPLPQPPAKLGLGFEDSLVEQKIAQRQGDEGRHRWEIVDISEVAEESSSPEDTSDQDEEVDPESSGEPAAQIAAADSQPVIEHDSDGRIEPPDASASAHAGLDHDSRPIDTGSSPGPPPPPSEPPPQSLEDRSTTGAVAADAVESGSQPSSDTMLETASSTPMPESMSQPPESHPVNSEGGNAAMTNQGMPDDGLEPSSEELIENTSRPDPNGEAAVPPEELSSGQAEWSEAFVEADQSERSDTADDSDEEAFEQLGEEDSSPTDTSLGWNDATSSAVDKLVDSHASEISEPQPDEPVSSDQDLEDSDDEDVAEQFEAAVENFDAVVDEFDEQEPSEQPATDQPAVDTERQKQPDAGTSPGEKPDEQSGQEPVDDFDAAVENFDAVVDEFDEAKPPEESGADESDETTQQQSSPESDASVDAEQPDQEVATNPGDGDAHEPDERLSHDGGAGQVPADSGAGHSEDSDISAAAEAASPSRSDTDDEDDPIEESRPSAQPPGGLVIPTDSSGVPMAQVLRRPPHVEAQAHRESSEPAPAAPSGAAGGNGDAEPDEVPAGGTITGAGEMPALSEGSDEADAVDTARPQQSDSEEATDEPHQAAAGSDDFPDSEADDVQTGRAAEEPDAEEPDAEDGDDAESPGEEDQSFGEFLDDMDSEQFVQETAEDANEFTERPRTVPLDALQELESGPMAVDVEESLALIDSPEKEKAFAAAEHLATAGRGVLPKLAPLFPGRLFVDRYQYTVDTMPPVNEHGPVLETLVRIGEASLAVVQENIDDNSLECRFYATFLLTVLPAAGMLPQLRERLFDRDQQTRTIAQHIVYAHRHHNGFEQVVVAPLRETLKESDEEFRVEIAADNLRRFRDIASVPLLVEHLQGHADRLQQLIHQALREITFQPLSPSPSEWRRWWFDADGQPRWKWLVEAMNSDDEEIRLLAFDEIEQLPGVEIDYHPQQPPKLRARAQRQLTELFEGQRQ